ncbi:hypothetical protein HUO13_31810 [Saccharopolyspora erythraea]|uniref:hypothetical protein n=1 Tax=Saccharopolyspora erythraea TaxID=1836 RepID=UPI001BA87956|nr:hypothetical protein [Saccharopolyspora erythraea]QUH04752.1 hypothetical protein HUO13_31810 [Saccharopolyspora erythraea]
MTDPFMDALATALAGQAVTALGAAGTKALAKVRELLRRRSDRDPETVAALEAAEGPDAGAPQIKALAERLDRVSQEDPDFGEELRAEGAPIHNDITASENSVVNVNHGNVDKLIQSREIHGGITFN